MFSDSTVAKMESSLGEQGLNLDILSEHLLGEEEAAFTINIQHEEEDTQQFANSPYWNQEIGIFINHRSDDIDCWSDGSEAASPAIPYGEFTHAGGIPNLQVDTDFQLSPTATRQSHWMNSVSPSDSEFLHPGISPRHRRSQSIESNRSVRSNESTSSGGFYLASSSSAFSSTEDLHIGALEIGDTGFSRVPVGHGNFVDHTSATVPINSHPSSASTSSLFLQNPNICHRRQSGVSIQDMLSLLTESGSAIISKDPDSIRQTFIHELTLKGGQQVGKKDFSKPIKLEIGTSATMEASRLRRKTEPVFFCELCKAGFTRKNGLLNHYRSHLGIADKHCMYCHRSFTTSLNRHIRKCKSNPNRGNATSVDKGIALARSTS